MRHERKKGVAAGWMRNLGLVLLGLAAGLVLVEAALRVARGAPPKLQADLRFRYIYLDIYEPFFREDSVDGMVVNAHWDSEPARFSRRKSPGEKRVFIIGESVARQYDGEVLRARLEAAAPAFDWTVVNCGMNGYDSYRILRVAREVMRYEPDLVVALMGNNEGWVGNGSVSVSRLPYRYPVLSRFWVTRAAAALVDPPVNVPREKVPEFFFSNLEEIVSDAARLRVPVVVTTLPNNLRVPHGGCRFFDQKEAFPAWWLIWKRPEAVREALEDRHRDREYYWMRGAALDRLGRHDAARECYRLDGNPVHRLLNEGIRRRGKDGEFLLVDFETLINRLADGSPGTEIFMDEVHFWPPVYRLFTSCVIDALAAFKSDGRRLDYEAVFPEICPEVSENDRLDVIIKDTERHIRGVAEGFPAGLERFLFYHVADRIPTKVELLKYFDRYNPRILEEFDQLVSRETLPEGMDDPKIALSLAFCVAGEALREQGRPEPALRLLDRAVEYAPGEPCPRLFRGLCRYDAGMREAAREDFGALAKLRPDCSWLTVPYLDSVLDNTYKGDE